jgi:transposase
MNFIQPKDRHQLAFGTLDDAIAEDHVVRFIDAFVNKLELDKLGFIMQELQKEGRPAYESRVFMKLYLYGYINGIRSSRRLQRECERNIELQWLLGKLVPNYHSIADFRKDNPKALRNTFKLFVLFLKNADLIGSELIAIDGTKVRAGNSKKNNYNPKKIERQLKYIEEKSNEYLWQLDQMDKEESPEKIKNIEEKIARLKQNKINYEALGIALEKSGEPQISTTDPDARALLVQGQVVEVSYNLQAAVDARHNLIVATHTLNRNDRNAMSAIALEAKENLQSEGFTALLDKGYHNGREIETCKNNDIKTICAPSEKVNSNAHGTTPEYVVTQFNYNTETDTYTCPEGQTLTTTGTWHKKTRERDSYQFKKYRTPACKTCPVKHLCTGRQDGGREIERSQYADAVEENNARYHANQALYRRRQEINEHIFGTIKRKWGYSYTDLKGLEKVNGEHALIMLVYNIKRCFTLLGIPTLLEKLKNWKPNYAGITLLQIKMASKERFKDYLNFQPTIIFRKITFFIRPLRRSDLVLGI